FLGAWRAGFLHPCRRTFSRFGVGIRLGLRPTFGRRRDGLGGFDVGACLGLFRRLRSLGRLCGGGCVGRFGGGLARAAGWFFGRGILALRFGKRARHFPEAFGLTVRAAFRYPDVIRGCTDPLLVFLHRSDSPVELIDTCKTATGSCCKTSVTRK